jgi:hypothetical protein
MTKLTEEEIAQIRAYETPTLALVKAITAGMTRGGRLMAQRAERRDDMAWREQIAEECRSWRRFLDALPAEPPAVYAAAHARILRWAAAVAEAGDEYAMAIEQADGHRLREASRKMSETPLLYVEVMRAVNEAVAKVRA